jgi:internalin A
MLGLGIIRLGRVDQLQWLPIPWVRTVPAETVSRPWQRSVRFSVRGMIVLVLVIGGWLGLIVRSARVQRDAVAAIEKAGGEVHFDWERKNGTVAPGGKPWEPARLVKFLGADYFGHVTHVSFATRGQLAKPTKELLAYLGEIYRQSDKLDDVQFAMREATFSHADDLWRRLILSEDVTPKPVMPLLKGLSKLTHLDLRDNDLIFDRLAHIEELTSLTTLDLGGTGITDSQMVHLKKLEQLSELHLDSVNISDAGLANLKGLVRISHLDLEKTGVTDAGLVHLEGLTHLRELSVAFTQVTDRGLVHLKELTNLSYIDLSSTGVTDAGVNELKLALPNVTIVR